MTKNIDWTAVRDEGVGHLRRLIQIDTTNPPGNESLCATYLDRVLRDEGIEPTIVETVPGRAALVARLRGSGKAKPILYTAHMDVVGVEPAEWSVPPFSGEIRNGYVYGRGAIDDKGMLAAELMAVLLVKRHLVDAGVTLQRDLIFAATADEETGGEHGFGWLIAKHPDLIRAEFALNEGGRMRIVNGRPLYAAVQTAEKAVNVVTVTATGPAGHASVPLEGNAVVHLARAVGIIAMHREEVKLLPTTREFFARLGAIWEDKERGRAMQDVAGFDATRVARGAAVLDKVPLLGALLRTGISPTILSAGIRHNVIPASGTATLSVRTLPGERIDDVVARLRAAVDDPQVEITCSNRGIDGPESDFESPMFAAVRDGIAELDPSIVTVPYMSTGATESAKLRAWGVQTFGLLPFPMGEDDERRMHGADERIPLTSFEFGVRLLYNVARRTIC